jgi:hypothetical protein
MTAERGYASPAAFRRALTDRLSALAKQGNRTADATAAANGL